MSAQNVEIVRALYARWDEGDFSDVSWARPDIEFVSPDTPEAVNVRGLAAMGLAWDEWLSEWEGFRTEAEEFLDLGDTVLVLTRFDGRAKSSGLSARNQPGAAAFTLREGKVVRLVIYAIRERGVAETRAATGS